MKPSLLNSNPHFIGGWYIDESLCDRMVRDFEHRKADHFEAHSARGYTYLPSCDMDIDLITEYEAVLQEVVTRYKNLYTYSHENLSSWQLSFPYNIQKYDPGKHYSVWHCENNGYPQYRQRHLAFMTYLNTVTDGGETVFYYQNTRIRPEKGLTLIWPAHFTHTHKGIPSETQEKYITTGWFDFFDTDSFLEQQRNVTDEDFWKNLAALDRNLN